VRDQFSTGTFSTWHADRWQIALLLALGSALAGTFAVRADIQAADGTVAEGKGSAQAAQRSVLQVGELIRADGKLTVDRDKATHVLLGGAR
jgi:hypothetical protein